MALALCRWVHGLATRCLTASALSATLVIAGAGCVSGAAEAGYGVTSDWQDAEASAARPMDERATAFITWLERVRAQDPEVRDLYYAYYDAATDRPWFLSTMMSAEMVRFFLQISQRDRAVLVGDALLRWQHTGEGDKGERLAGAFPSELEKVDGSWRPRYLYDSGDNLVVMESLLDLYEATGEERFLRAVRETGSWLRDVMSRGDMYGVWLEPMGAPMKAVTSSGDFDNRIAVGRGLFGLPALERLSALTGDSSFAELAGDARALLELGQMPQGGFADHYDPGWPAQPFDLSRFMPYGADGSVVADDSLRAAIALMHVGHRDQADRFGGWLAHDNGRVPGYLTLATGQEHFPPGNRKYYDIISSALYAVLGSELGLEDAHAAAQFVRQTQALDGGWYWGWDAQSDAPVDTNQSTLTGVWALIGMPSE